MTFDDTEEPNFDARGAIFEARTDGARHIIGAHIKHFKTVPSTMDVARTAAIDGAPEGLVIVADRQTDGRGRHGRSWISQSGQDVLLSVVLRPRPGIIHELMLMAALAAAATVETATGAISSIKWPNDVRVDGKKVCGVLAEAISNSVIRRDNVDAPSIMAVLGIGLNVNMDPALGGPETAQATSLRVLTGRMHSRADTLATLITQLDDMYASLQRGETLLPEWRSRLETLGQEVNVTMGHAGNPGRVISGIAEDVDELGRLLVRDADGRVWPMSAGEVTLQRKATGNTL